MYRSRIHLTWLPILVDVRLIRLGSDLGPPHPMFLLCLAMTSMVSVQGCGFLDHFKNIFSSSSLLSFSFYSIYWRTDLISLEYYSQNFSVLSFCSTERERATSFTLVTVGLVGLERGMPFPAENCKEQTPTALKRKVAGTLQSPLQGLRLSGSCPWWVVGCAHRHTHALTHTYTPQWQMTYWNNFRAVLWLLRQPMLSWLSSGHVTGTLTSARGRACGWVRTVKGLWEAGWVLAAAAALHAAASASRGCGAWTVKSCTSAVWGTQFALYTIVRCVYKSQRLSPLSHLLQVCLHEQLLLYPEKKMWSSFYLFIWGGISGIWLNLDSCSGK